MNAEAVDRSIIGSFITSFNDSVGSGNWDPYVAGFTAGATIEFVGPPVGPFVGRDAIATAYAEMPPEETIELIGPVRRDDAEWSAPFRWTVSGGTGTMRFTIDDGLVRRLVISFD